jgi:hypothetical protein
MVIIFSRRQENRSLSPHRLGDVVNQLGALAMLTKEGGGCIKVFLAQQKIITQLVQGFASKK